MLEQSILQNYLDILREELVPATGCTEPIAIAYCAATLRELLGALPERVDAAVSGNILKNVKSVVVPNTGGRKGIGPAIAVGLVAGDAARDLQVISAVTEKQLAELDAYLQRVEITVSCSHSPCQLDIDLRGSCGSHTARVRITNHHTNIVCLERDGEVLRELPEEHPTVHYVYVLDEYDKLVGVLSLRTLVLTDDSKVMHDIMYTDLITASPDETEDDVAADVFKYDLPAMPVVDERGKLLGIVTTDDAWDAIEDDVSGDKTKKSVLLGLGATAAAILFLVLYTLVLFQIIGYSWR